MVARFAIARLLFVLAALVVLAWPSGARAHAGHDHATLSSAHAPAASVKPLMNTAALQAITAGEEIGHLAEVAVSAQTGDDHDCSERGCKIGQSCGACASALTPATPPLLAARAAREHRIPSDREHPGLTSVYDGPPPKTLA